MEYTEELPLGYLSPEQYFAMAIQAVQRLRWAVASAAGGAIVCHTRGLNNLLGQHVSIVISAAGVVFTSRAANEYYWPDGQNEKNAALFRRAVEDIAGKAHNAEKARPPLSREKYGALVPSASYLTTPVLLYLNVLVFVAMVLAGLSPTHPTAPELLLWGGNMRQAVAAGQWWRLLSYQFLHAGIVHMGMNMLALAYIGTSLEPLLGRFRFAAAYVLTGVGAGLLSMVVHPASVGVGASGSIFGMYGVFLAMLTTSYIPRTARKTMLRSILLFVVYNLLSGMQGNVDNAAHIGGLLSGAVIGYAYLPGVVARQSIEKQITATTVMAVATALLVVATILHYR